MRTPFCPISLTDWTAAAAAVGVRAIPATVVTEIRRDDALHFDEPGAHRQRLTTALEAASEACGPDDMLRWDCCAGGELKHRMATRGDCDAAGRRTLYLDDPRFYAVAESWPREMLPIVQRPWIAVERDGGWPREYRAFVTDGDLDGISSYYPQRPLRRRDDEIEEVARLAGLLTGIVPTPFEWPRGARALAEMIAWDEGLPNESRAWDGIHYTVDFAATADGIVLIEGGPPHFLGAHPCCFAPGRTTGIALRPQAGSETRKEALSGPSKATRTPSSTTARTATASRR